MDISLGLQLFRIQLILYYRASNSYIILEQLNLAIYAPIEDSACPYNIRMHKHTFIQACQRIALADIANKAPLTNKEVRGSSPSQGMDKTN